MIWTPEQDNPHVGEDASEFLVGAFLDHTPPVVMARAQRLLQADQPVVDTYVRGVAHIVSEQTREPWVYPAMVAGAGLAGILYQFSGFWPDVDEAAFKTATSYIAGEPKPEVFDAATITDRSLAKVIELSVPLIASDFEPEGIAQGMRLGAGCVRIFYGHALNAA